MFCFGPHVLIDAYINDASRTLDNFERIYSVKFC